MNKTGSPSEIKLDLIETWTEEVEVVIKDHDWYWVGDSTPQRAFPSPWQAALMTNGQFFNNMHDGWWHFTFMCGVGKPEEPSGNWNLIGPYEYWRALDNGYYVGARAIDKRQVA